jgi:uncharacterized membrane protein (UPF0127 family)
MGKIMGKILALIAIVVSLISLSLKGDIKSIQVGNTVLDKIEIVSTAAAQEKGLSGRSSIESDYGMLFVFDKPAKYTFWMKDMNFPIDMIWLDEDWKVVGIEAEASPSSYPDTFGPEAPAKYVLETQAGLITKENIKIGGSLKFTK